MTDFKLPPDLSFNRGLIADPSEFAQDAGAASWLYLCGEEFAQMDGGMSYEQVEAAVPTLVNVVADPPVPFDLEIAQQLLDALDGLPRPALVTCRTGPRSSAIVYLYAGLQAGASADDVLAAADADEAPFTKVEPYRELVVNGLSELSV